MNEDEELIEGQDDQEVEVEGEDFSEEDAEDEAALQRQLELDKRSVLADPAEGVEEQPVDPNTLPFEQIAPEHLSQLNQEVFSRYVEWRAQGGRGLVDPEEDRADYEEPESQDDLPDWATSSDEDFWRHIRGLEAAGLESGS